MSKPLEKVPRDFIGCESYEEDLRRRENGLVVAQRIAHVGSWEYSLYQDEAYWSDELYRIFGLSPRDGAPRFKTFFRLVHPDDRALIRKAIRDALYAHKHPGLDFRLVRPDGEVRSVHAQYEMIHDEMGKPVKLVGTVHDITERKALEERLRHQALHDPLTGLPNRALLMDRLGQALARMERREKLVAVLFLDLDNFKVVNDSLGHEAGDWLLVEVTGRLSDCVRPEDTVARLGGDEFVILLEDAGDLDDAIRVAERISKALRAPFDLEEQEVYTSVSIGIALGASAHDQPGDLLRNADLALYGAKNKGKTRYEVFDASMIRRSVKRLEMESALRKALERDEFTVLYQPKMLLEEGTITGVEALVRWEHPERGLMSPSEFVPLAEETGLIVPIGYKVLEETCRQTRAWQQRYTGAPRTVYVNLSARQFDDPGLVEEVMRVVRKTGVEPNDLALEIAENVLMSDTEAAVSKLTALRGAGVRVVVDDFGTAYSSLSSLGHLPMNSLNVDRSLIFRLGVAPEDTAIVSAAINLAHSLGWEVTAEGVETADQLARLRELGCDMAQGYHLWEPLTSEEVSASLATGFQR
jgi:diguanylate cyclase (GGDEF)-like protein/PAS domain S-box-containing protein